MSDWRRELVAGDPLRHESPLAAVDVGTMIHDVVRLVSADAVLRQSRIVVDVAADLPPVMGDRIELQQVILNLLINALDVLGDCPAHEREVTVSAIRDGAAAVKVAVRAVDSRMNEHVGRRLAQGVGANGVKA